LPSEKALARLLRASPAPEPEVWSPGSRRQAGTAARVPAVARPPREARSTGGAITAPAQEELPQLPKARPKRKFQLTAPEPHERDIHETVAKTFDAILLPPVQWCTYPAGAAQLSPQQQARYSRIGLKRSWPDTLISYKGMYGLELKIPGGRLSKTRMVRTKRGSPRILIGQEEMFPLLLASGGFVAIEIAHSVDEAIEWLDHWEIPHR
jgi:hypothetical protein